MKSILFLALAVAMVMGAPFVDPGTDEEAGVLILNDKNFETTLAANDYLFVEFYAPWCGHCKQLMPEWRKAAVALKDTPTPVTLAKVDVTVEKALQTKYNIKSFPTLYFFAQGKKLDYTGGRTGEEIFKWITKKVGDVSQHIETEAQLKEFKEDHKVGIVYFTTKQEGENWQAFEFSSKAYDKLQFAHVSNPALISAEEGVQDGDLVLFKHFDEGKNVYSKPEFKRGEIKTFIDSNSIGVLMEFDEIAVQAVFHKKNPTLFLFHSGTEESNRYLELMKQVAPKNKGGKLIFTVTSPTDGHGQWTQLANYLRVDARDAPFFMIVHSTPTKNEKNKLEGEVTAYSLQKFIDDYNGTKLAEDLQQDNTQQQQQETQQQQKEQKKAHDDL